MNIRKAKTGSQERLPRSIGLGDSGSPDLAERYEECLSGLGSEALAQHPLPEEREDADDQPRPSEVFERSFGPERGIELPLEPRRGTGKTPEDPCLKSH